MIANNSTASCVHQVHIPHDIYKCYIFKVVQESTLISEGSPVMKTLIDSTSLISSNHQPPNLKNVLMSCF